MERHVALITGGMGAVGQATARALASEGYVVYLSYFSSTAKDAAACIASLPGTGHEAIHCNIADYQSVADMIARVLAKSPAIDIVVHTAADRIVRSTLEAMTASDFRSQFEASVFGAFNLFAQVLPLMKKQGTGLIVGITTAAIREPEGAGKMSGYIAAKYALEGLLRETARECKATSVRVNAIAPDLMQTKLTADLPPRLFEFAAEKDSRGRITTPDDVAQKVLYLLSDEGKTINDMSLAVATDETWSL